jgi:hypothetical protein
MKFAFTSSDSNWSRDKEDFMNIGQIKGAVLGGFMGASVFLIAEAAQQPAPSAAPRWTMTSFGEGYGLIGVTDHQLNTFYIYQYEGSDGYRITGKLDLSTAGKPKLGAEMNLELPR